MTAGEGLADSILCLVDTILCLVDTILHLREPSHAPACPTLDALLTGRARPFTRPGSRSGIAKSPRDGALRVTPVGLEGDEQATCASMGACRDKGEIHSFGL